MKSFRDEIKGNLDNFTAPVSQATRNFRDNIKDGIDDAIADHQENSEQPAKGKKKGCIWTVIKWYLILLVISTVLTECGFIGDEPSESNVPDATQESQIIETRDPSEHTEEEVKCPLSFIEKQVSYAEECNIDLYRFSSEEAKLSEWLENADEKMVYVQVENIFGADQYGITEDRHGYLYYGELKDNRPHGYGILFAQPEDSDCLLTYEDRSYILRYIGSFVDGQFDGFGVLFAESEHGSLFVERLCPYDKNTGENIDYFLWWVNYAEYFGEFSKGYKHGVGNSFVLGDFYVGIIENVLSELDMDHPTYSVDVGEYKKDERNGTFRCYIGGHLRYEGHVKDNMYEGYGKLYYYGSDVLEYEGNFKSDMRHGSGTSYSEEGGIIYQGEWKYDDYA